MKNILIGLPVFIASLLSFFWGGDPELAYKKDEAKMNKIVNHAIKELSCRYNLIPIGRGGGNTDNKSRLESVSFQLKSNITKEQARQILIESVELILHFINENKEITHYLLNVPFTYRNVEVIIFIRHPDGSRTYDPEIGVVSSGARGMVAFETNDPNDEYKYASDVEEPYEEAYRIATNRDYPKPASLPVQSSSEVSPQNK